MRLIEGRILDEASVAELAERLGVGPRHLLRLFLRHTRAIQSDIAATRRIQAAKRCLLDPLHSEPQAEAPRIGELRDAVPTKVEWSGLRNRSSMPRTRRFIMWGP